jgi:hypothetical protein
MSDSANAAGAPAKAPPQKLAATALQVKITKPVSGGSEPSPLLMKGWHEPISVDVLQVWYRKADGTGGEGPVTPLSSIDPNNPDRVLWEWTFSNNLVTGQNYEAYAHVELNSASADDNVPFTGQ